MTSHGRARAFAVLRDDPRGPAWLRVANRLTKPIATHIPAQIQDRAFASQRASMPFFGPQPATVEGPVSLVDAGPLYAGANVGRITDVRTAAELVRSLVPG